MSYRDYVMVPRADWQGLCDTAREKCATSALYTSGTLVEEFKSIVQSKMTHKIDFGEEISSFVNAEGRGILSLETGDSKGIIYYRLTATADDPYICIGGMSAEEPFTDKTSDQLRYIVIKYRTSCKARGEFYTSRSDGRYWTSAAGVHVAWDWVPDGQWHLTMIDARHVWGNVTGVRLHSFRFDFLERYVAGEHIDVAYIKFFAERNDAVAFMRSEQTVTMVTPGEEANSRTVYCSYDRYYTGARNVPLNSYVYFRGPYPDGYFVAGNAPRTCADGVAYVSDGKETVLCESEARSWLTANGGVKDTGASYDSIILRGWVDPAERGLEITSFAYRISTDQTCVEREDAAWVVYDDGLCSALGSHSARRHAIVIDVSGLSHGIYSIDLYVRLSDGELYSMLGTWGSVEYCRRADYVDAAGNAYFISSGRVVKNGAAVQDAILAAVPGNEWQPFLAYNPQIEVFEAEKGISGRYVYADTVTLSPILDGLEADPVPVVVEGAKPVPLVVTSNGVYNAPEGGYSPVTVEVKPRLMPLTVTANGTHTIEAGAGVDGFYPVTVNVPVAEPVTEPLTVTENGTYTPAEGVDGFSSVTVEVQASGGGSDKFKQMVDGTITEVTAEDLEGATKIREFLFFNNQRGAGVPVVSVEIPASVANIGQSSFQNCASLMNVVFQENSKLYNIGQNAFSGCSSLKNFMMPSGVTSIGAGAFNECALLETIVIPDGVTAISEDVFRSCISLSSITFGNNTRSIGKNAFNGCNTLTSIILPDSVTSIKGYSFNCKNVSNVVLGSGIESLSSMSFYCPQLMSVTINATTPPSIASNSFTTHADCRFYVPAESVDAYKAATNWSARADYIFAIEEDA